MNNTVKEAYKALENESRQKFSYLNAKTEAVDRKFSKHFKVLNRVLDELEGRQKLLGEEIRSIDQSVQQGGATKIIYRMHVTPPVSPEDLIKAYIVFDNENKFHPHRFIEIFENYVTSAELVDAHKCVTFRQIVTIDDAEEWKRITVGEFNFAELKKSFLEHFWSRGVQREAMEAFGSQQIIVDSTNSWIYELEKWISTLKNVNDLDIDEILHTVYLKLPDDLSCRVTYEEMKNEELFLAKLFEFKDDYRDDSIVVGKIANYY